IRLIKDSGKEPSDEYLALYFCILSDDDLSHDLGGLLLTLFDSVDTPEYAHRYLALYKAKRAIEHALANRYKQELQDLYQRHDQSVSLTAPIENQIPAIKERQVKNSALALLSTLDTPEINTLIRAQLDTGAVATDRL